MEKILSKLYEIQQNIAQPFAFFDKKKIDKECQCYDYLYNHLPEELKKIFLEYLELRNLRNNHELQAAYESGFKTAVQLFMEVLRE